MAQPNMRALRLFRFAGIDVFLHWSWALVALVEIQLRKSLYSSLLWNISEYIALFAIVLLHEFGHALACKQVGGRADTIMLWPLGGIAYVSPPPRPGAHLWSIAAGPLVNVFLGVILSGALYAARSAGLSESIPDGYSLLRSIWFMNFGLLIFNILPVYPLDGGQILQSILWFFIGQSKSLVISSWIGLFGAAGLVALALTRDSPWLIVLAIFIFLQCRRGMRHAKVLRAIEKAPRHETYQCPSCKQSPLVGQWWLCPTCKSKFDTFAHNGKCPSCGKDFPTTQCPNCKTASPFARWQKTTITI
jgi:Zn-dependent protease